MLHKRSIKEKLLKGGAWAFVGKLVTSLATLAANALLARLLSPEEMGAYFLTLSLVSMGAIMAQFGLTQAIVKLVAESLATGRPTRARLAVKYSVRMTGVGALLVACILTFGGGLWLTSHLFNSRLMSQVMGLAAAWVVIVSFQNLIAEVFRGFHDVRLATFFGGLVTGALILAMFLGLWIFQGFGDLHQIILITLVASFSSVAISSLILWDKLSDLSLPSGDEVSFLEIIRISWPLWVTSLIMFALSQVDLWIMGALRMPDEVATYGAAIRTVGLVIIPLIITNAVLPPIIAQMYAENNIKELETALRSVATITGLPSLIALLLLMVFGEAILLMLFGEFYQAGYMVISIVSVGYVVNVWSGSCGLVLMLTGHQSAMMKITIFCGIITTLLAWFLVKRYGGEGAAFAAASGMILQNLITVIYAKKNVGVRTYMSLKSLTMTFHKGK